MPEMPRNTETLGQIAAELRTITEQLKEQSRGNDSHSRAKKEVSPILLTILAGIFTGLLAIANSFFQARQAQQLEEIKLRSTLILKAIESTDPEERKKALKFYVDTGLLDDPQGRITAIQAQDIPRAPQSSGQIIDHIGGTTVKDVGGAVVYRSELALDIDGAPRAYHPNGHGLDDNANAQFEGRWLGVVTDAAGKPVPQGPRDPAPGYYISTTSLQDMTRPKTDPRRYVDSSTIPYIVIPGGHIGRCSLGDYAAVFNEQNGKLVFAIAADAGPKRHVGEGSVALAAALGLNSDARAGFATESKIITTVVFPGSADGHWPASAQDIERPASALFERWGGLDRLKRESKTLSPETAD
jgi:hypothetical protein